MGLALDKQPNADMYWTCNQYIICDNEPAGKGIGSVDCLNLRLIEEFDG